MTNEPFKMGKKVDQLEVGDIVIFPYCKGVNTISKIKRVDRWEYEIFSEGISESERYGESVEVTYLGKKNEQSEFPINVEGINLFLKTLSPSTQEYFHRMLKRPEACDFLRNTFFIELERKFMSKDLEEYLSINSLYQEVDIKSKEKEAKQNWFEKNVLRPLLTPFMSKILDIDMKGMRKKQRGELGDAMFLLSVYLHL